MWKLGLLLDGICDTSYVIYCHMLCAKIENISYIRIPVYIVCFFRFAVLLFTVGDIGTSYAFEKPSST